ncbi:DNA polymerase III subunit delta [Furfurilactobacillus entadae]|uniref:DNA polymerase III subunit delta n=1 Tax=Furfurilactobacillus entadae TaxID=2922307 RepID=UPI0035E87DA8
MDVQALKKALLNGDKQPLYLVLGTENYLLNEVRDAFKAVIPAEQAEMNVGSYDMEQTPVAVALDDAMSMPFFGDHRLVLIDKPGFLTGETSRSKVDHDLDALLHYIQHPEPTTIFVIMAPYEKLDGRKKIVKVLKKAAVTIETAPLTEQAARQAVIDQAATDQYQLADDALNLLVQRTNADLSLMMSNLTKLELFAVQSKVIDREAVSGLVPQSLADNVFDLVTAVLKRQVSTAVMLYHDLLATGEEPLRINAVLVSQFRLLLQVKVLASRGLSQGTLAGQLKVHPYRVKLAMQSNHQFSQRDLSRAFLGLINIETQLKQSRQDPELLFNLFMLKFTNQAA